MNPEQQTPAPVTTSVSVNVAHDGSHVVVELTAQVNRLRFTPGQAEGMATQLKLMAQQARRAARLRAP